MWEILLLDFFAVGDCGTGLFCCGRFYCWTFLLWEILMLDFLASGQMNRQALLLGLYCQHGTSMEKDENKSISCRNRRLL